MDIPVLRDILIIFTLSIAVLLICFRLRIPTIVGFLLTGILCGPYGLGLVEAVEDVTTLSKIGLAILLFTIGLEISFKKIVENRRYFFFAGPIQVALTTLCGFTFGQLIGRPVGESVFLGFLLSLSSTAIVLRLLQERSETKSPHGRLAVGVLIFQDVILIPMMLITPVLAGHIDHLDKSVFLLLGEGVLILAIIFYSALRLVPKLLFIVARTRSRELFMLTVLVICFGVAWVVSWIGLPLSLGAFLAGLVISESDFSYQAIGDVVPIQDIFISFFFVSVGMLVDIQFILTHPLLIGALVVSVFLMKSTFITGTTLLLGLPLRTALLAGISLGQVGEFSFVLATFGINSGIGTDYLNQLFLAVAILSMAFTPSLINYAPSFVKWLLKLPLPTQVKGGLEVKYAPKEEELENHVIIIGYGFSGKNLARSTHEAHVPYVVLDLNPEVVVRERKKGIPIHFGDGTRPDVLTHLSVSKAKIIAILINDPIASLHIVDRVRRMNESVYIIVRTRFLAEMQSMFQMGANDVIPDEFGSSVEIFTRVLQKYDAPPKKIEELVDELREEGYELMRHRYMESTIFSGMQKYISDVGTNSFVVGAQSGLVGKSLEESQLRTNHGITVILIRREGETIYNIDAETTLEAGDIVIVMGKKERIIEAKPLFHPV